MLPPGPFQFVMADPAWRFAVWSRKTGLRKSADKHYSTMTLDEVKALPVRSVADKDCMLWLWCTAPMLKEGIEVLEAWGFKYASMGVWHKRTVNGKTQFGTGYRLRSACEPFLIGTIGNPKNQRNVRNLVEGQVREHSRKPDEAYRAAELLMPHARRLDMFSRESRDGWVSWGAEAGKFNPQIDLEDLIKEKAA